MKTLATQAECNIVESVNTLSGTVDSISCGIRTNTISIMVKTAHGFATIPLPATHAREYIVGANVVLSIGEIR